MTTVRNKLECLPLTDTSALDNVFRYSYKPNHRALKCTPVSSLRSFL